MLGNKFGVLIQAKNVHTSAPSRSGFKQLTTSIRKYDFK